MESKDVERGLNLHGYAFQNRVIHEIAELVARGATRWKVASTEVPVVVGEKQTRADIVLIDQSQAENCRISAIECKRVNRAFGSWCFAKSPYAFPPWLHRQVCGELIHRVQRDYDRFESAGFGMKFADKIFDIGFSLKVAASGDTSPVSNDRDAVETACFQALQGLNGLINTIFEDSRFQQLFRSTQEFWFLPCVFTTAKLVIADVDLRNVEIAVGDATVAHTKEVPWLIYQYPMSPLLKHHVNRVALGTDRFDELVARDYWRSIAIVSSSGIEEFLGLNLLDHFSDDGIEFGVG